MSITKFKIVFAGDQNVGKTSIISRFMFDSYSQSSMSTVGIDFLTKTLQVENQTVRLQLWDTAGQQRYRSLIPSYIKDADGCVVVLDITASSTFEGIPKWIDFVKEIRGDDAVVFLVLNKIDSSQAQVDLKSVQHFAQTQGLYLSKVSAKTGEGIQQLFRTLAAKLYQKNDQVNSDVKTPSNMKRIPNRQNNKVNLSNNEPIQNGNGCKC